MMMRFNLSAFAATCGIVWGLCVLAFTWWRLLFEKPKPDDTMLSRKYIGYSVTPLGSLIGFAWGLVDAAAKGLGFAWLYNKLADRMPMSMDV